MDDDNDDDWVEGGGWKLGMLLEEGFEFFWRCIGTRE